MRDLKSNELNDYLLLLDIVATVLAFVVAFYIRLFFFPELSHIGFSNHLFLLPLIIVLINIPFSYLGGYKSPADSSWFAYSKAVFQAVIMALGALLAFLFFLQIEYVSRLVIVLFACIETIFLSVIRFGIICRYRQLVRKGDRALKILIVGTKTRAINLLFALQEQMVLGVQVIGFIDPDPSLVGNEISGIPVIGTVDNIHDCLKNNVIDEVVIAISRSLLKDAEPIVLACEEEGIKLRFMADVFNVQVARVSLSTVKGIPLLTMEPVSQDPQQLMIKRVFDLALTVLAFPFLIPLFIIVALAIKLESDGPVFFVQQRIGLRKHEFPMFKFRSMYEDAEDRLKELEHLNEADGPIFKMKEDPRITKIGRIIRKTSIDELPQLINVLRGEMSLVGPRPMSVRDVELFDKAIQRKRFSVQPGLTCIWQVSGRSNLTFDQWLELDLEYIDNWSLGLDVKLLFKTIPAVLFSKGAV